MGKKTLASKAAPAPAPPAPTKTPRDVLEDCRRRLQSIEQLLASSPRDALALAAGLLDDAVVLLAALHPSDGARASSDREAMLRALDGTPAAEHLLAARRWLEAARTADVVPADGVAPLRRVVADLADVVGRVDVTGLAAVRQAARRATWVGVGIAAAVVIALVVVAYHARAARDRRAGEFQAWLVHGNARLSAGDHEGAVEALRKAIAALPDTDRTAGAWNDLGWALQQLGRPEEALAAYRKALLLRPEFPLARNNLEAAQRQLDLRKTGKAPPPGP